ncbi:APC amino acid permease [Mycena floridula]|nr:APC amino acid permease [Mycena floridula]
MLELGKPGTNASVLAVSDTSDEALLASLGYKQELKRHFSPLNMFGISFSIVGLVSSFSSVLIFSIPVGGAAMVWGWTLCSIFLTCIALALAELASANPTAGGLYYWTFFFSPPKWRCFLSWTVGYSNTLSNIASVASVDWGCAVQIMAAVSIGSDLSFSATTAQTYGLYCGILIIHGLICCLNPKIMAKLQVPFIIVNLLLCGAIIIGLPAATPKEFRNTAKFALGGFFNNTGWPNGFAFILSFLTPMWTLGCFDAPIHMSEEASNASTAIPFAIVSSTVSSLILGWGINVALAFCMGTDIDSIVNSPIEQPMATILFNSLGKKGTLVVWSFVIFVQFAIGAGILTTCSRQIFAFSRDGGLPGSRWIYYVNPRTYVPSNAVWFSVGLSLLLGAIAFAGPTAISAIFALTVTGQYTSYSIPLMARFLGGTVYRPGPFSLGVLSLPVTVVAVSWMTLMTVIIMFPSSPSPHVGTMNYTAVVQGGSLAFSTMYFLLPKFGGMSWFTGPISTVRELNEVDGSQDLSLEKHD